MSDNIEYVIKGEDDKVQISEEGYLTIDNIKSMRFEFGPPNDITESLAKKNTSTVSNISVTQKGRTGYAPGSCTYPDGNKSSTIVVAEAFVQYRQGVLRDNSRYGIDYVCIGISPTIITKMKSDAKRNSSMSLTTKKGVELIDGCLWFSCSLGNLRDEGITIISGEGDEYNSHVVDLQQIFKDFKKTMKATVMFTMSGSITTEKMDEALDLINGKFVLTFKPLEIILTDESDKVGPTLEDTNKRNNEGMLKTQNQVASSRLAQYAMKKLSVQ